MKEKKYFFKRVLAGALASMLCLNPLLGAGIAYADDVQTEPQKHKVTVETEGVDNARVVFKGTDKTELEFKEGEKFQLEIKKDNADDQIFPTDIKATDEKGKDISETLKVGEEPFSFIMPKYSIALKLDLQNYNINVTPKPEKIQQVLDYELRTFNAPNHTTKCEIKQIKKDDKVFYKLVLKNPDVEDNHYIVSSIKITNAHGDALMEKCSPTYIGDADSCDGPFIITPCDEKLFIDVYIATDLTDKTLSPWGENWENQQRKELLRKNTLKPMVLAAHYLPENMEDILNKINGLSGGYYELGQCTGFISNYVIKDIYGFSEFGEITYHDTLASTLGAAGYKSRTIPFAKKDSTSDLRAGDILIWGIGTPYGHTAVCTKGGYMPYITDTGDTSNSYWPNQFGSSSNVNGRYCGYKGNVAHNLLFKETNRKNSNQKAKWPCVVYRFPNKPPKPKKAPAYVDVKKGLWGSTNKFANNAYGASECMNGAEIGLYDSDDETLLHTFKMNSAGESDGAYKLGTKEIGLKQSFYLREISAPKYTIINNGYDDYGRAKTSKQAKSYKCSVTYGEDATTATVATNDPWFFHNIPRANNICVFKNMHSGYDEKYLNDHPPIGTKFRIFTTREDAEKCANDPSHTTNRAKGDPSVGGFRKNIPTQWVDIPDANVVNPWDGTEHSGSKGTFGWANENWKGETNKTYQAWFCGLPQGQTYYIAEVQTNEYYVRSTDVVEVNVPFDKDSNLPLGTTRYGVMKNKPSLTYVRVNKESAKPECTNENSNYSLDGAQYGLYEDSGCKRPIKQLKDGENAVLTTNANGVAESAYLEDVLQDDVIYAKEIKASRGYELDDTVHTININKWSSNYKCYYGEFTSKEPVLVDPFNALVKKVNADGVSRPLTGAKFQIDYYGVNVQNVSGNASESTLEGLIKGKNPTRKWVFKTNRNGVMDAADKSLFVPGESDKLWYDKKGHPSMPQGIYTIKEIKAPNGFSLNKKVYTRLVHPASGENEFIETSEINEKSLSLKLKKRQGYYNGLDKEKNDILLEGAEFKHIRPNKKAQTYTTDKNGYIQINGLDDGKHVLYETKAPEGYKVNPIKIEFEVVAPNGNGERIIKYDKSKYGKETADGKVEMSLFNDTDRQGVVCLVEETPKEYDFKVRKVNDLNLPLRGAVFGIADNIEMKNAKELTSSVIGEVNFEDLRPGTEYYFAELDAPAGYRPVITKDGKMKVWKFKVVKDNPRDDKFRFEFTDTETGNTTVVDAQNKESGNVKLKGSRDKRVVEFKCVNARTHKLPGTGSKALPIILLISGGCIVAAVILKKKNK